MPEDTSAILELIERETTAFLCRDFEAWANCWVQDEGIRRLGSLSGGILDYIEGWASGGEEVQAIFEKFPVPNPTAAQSMRRSNVSVRVSAEMAWASFDQYGEETDDPLVAVGLSHQIRILEKQGAHWKISMAGHGETGLEYLDFPAIRIDASCRIEWMNEAAQRELYTHPALTKSGAYLRGRFGADDKRLRETVVEVSGLTVMDRRLSIQQPGGRTADPVILAGDSTDGQHIVWVSSQNRKLLVTFCDKDNERARMHEAAELYGLSPAQLRVAELLLEGFNLQKVADMLGISSSTAKTHLSRMFDKTGVRNQTALVSKLLGVSPPG